MSVSPAIAVVIRVILCILNTYYIANILRNGKVLQRKRLHEVVSYITSIITISVVHYAHFEKGFQYWVVFLVCILFSIFTLFPQSSVSKNNYEFLKSRHAFNFLIYFYIKLVWLYPICFAVLMILGHGSYYYFENIYYKTNFRIAELLKYLTGKTNTSAICISITILFHIFSVNQYFNSFALFDLCLSIVFLTADENMSNLTTIRTSLKYGFDVKDDDISTLIKKWTVSSSPENIAKLLLNLSRSNKLKEETRKNIIDLGSNNTNLITPSFISIFLQETKPDSDELISKCNIIKQILHKHELGHLNVVELVRLSSIMNKSNKKIFRLSLNIFKNTDVRIGERIYASNALIKQIQLNPAFVENPSVIKSLKRIALQPKGSTYENKELLISLIALQCMEQFMTELPYDFYDNYYNINIRSNLKLSNHTSHGKVGSEARMLTIKAVELSKLDKRLGSHTITTKERFALLETLSVILYNGYTIDTSIFNNFKPKEWHSELLTYILLGRSIESDIQGWSEIKVKEFMEQINLLKSFVRKNVSNDVLSTRRIEHLLKSLINKQNKYNFNLSQIINILIVSQTQSVHVDILLNDDCNFIEELIDMEFLWLGKMCDDRQILRNRKININSDSHSDLYQLHQLLEIYDVSTVKTFINKVKKESNMFDLICLVNILNDSHLTDYNKHVFLRKLSSESIDVWKLQLSHLVVRHLIRNEFPNYSNKKSNEPQIPIKIKKKSSKMQSQLNKIFPSKKETKRSKFIDKSSGEKNLLNDYLGDDKCNLYEQLSSGLHQMEENTAKLLSLGGWSIQRIALFVQSLDSLDKIHKLTNAIKIIIDYDLIEEDGIEQIIKKCNTAKLEANVLQYAITKKFAGTYEKKEADLLNELKELNQNKNIDILKDSELRRSFHEVIEAYNGNSVLFVTRMSIKDWNPSEINNWAKCLKENRNNDIVLQSEKIAVIKKAMELASSITPRTIQIMSVLLMVNPAKEKGRLAQINTGEGKTTIIAMIAAYHGLHKHQVDVITTSPVLAVPQCDQQRKFYSMLDLSVSHNFNNTEGYLANICYGPVLDFEADVLRDECNKSNRRHGRKFDVVIVDEVDSMFIDGNNHIVMLADNMPGMNNLETLLAAIVIQIDAVANCVKEINGKPYYLQPENRINNDGTVKIEGQVNAIPLNCTIEKFIKDATETHIRKLVRDKVDVGSDYPEVQIPNHLRDFVCNIQIPKWIDSAITAKYVYENTKHYLIRDGKVLPVDAQNTGIVQENQHWSNGVHQFLQIKHGAKLYPESLTNNYISNIGFFTRYTNKIYGLTGTLGDKKSSDFLEKVYKLDTVIVPPFKKKQHVKLTPIIYNTESKWHTEIVSNCISKLNCGRAVLVITKFIKEIDELYLKFNDTKYDTSKILLFKTDEDTKVVERVIQPGEIILTTNIAGRGTDIKLAPSINENGGLHVCLTFLPINTRVEEQNSGRTSRTGNRGTSQLMLFHKSGKDIKYIRKERDDNQNNVISKAEKDVEIVMTKEIIFANFLRLLDKIKGRDNDRRSIELRAVQERFALWLKLEENFINNKTRSDAIQHFKTFEDNILDDDRHSKLIKNAYFHVLIGRALLSQKKYKKAGEEFLLAIDLDQHFAEHAYYNHGYCLLAQYGNTVSENKLKIEDAISNLRKARKLIQKREADLHLIQRASSSEIFSEQVQHKMNLYNIQKQAIDLAIGPDRDEIDEQIKSLNNRLEATHKDKKEEIRNIEDLIQTMETDKKRQGVIEGALERKRNIDVKLMNISECLPENEMEFYKDEIEEFNRNGFVGSFKVSEIKPIDWKAVFGLMVLGLGQLIAGAALAVYTLGSGATLAMSLITEGISDIIAAVKDGIINRDFNWASWAIQKAISITVSVVCAGIGAIKDVANTVSSGVKTLGKKVINETVKSGWKLVANKIGTELAKGVAKEIVNDLANYGLEKTLIPMIQEKLVEIIEGDIQDALQNNKYIKIMLELDAKNQNNGYENFVKSAAFELLDTTCKSKLLNIGKQIATGIADGKIKYFATGRKIGEAVMALNDLSSFVPKFISKLNEKIENKAKSDKLNEKESEIGSMLQNEDEKKQYDDKKPFKQSENIVNEEATATQSNPEPMDVQDDIKLNKGPEEQVRSDKPKRKKVTDSSQLSKIIVSSVSMNMLSIIKGKMINPALQAGVNYSMQTITSGLDATLNQDIENYRSLKRVIHYQNEGYRGESKNKLINKSIDENDPSIHKANELIKEVRNGEKCGLPQLGAISDVTNRPIEVYDEKGRLKFTIGDNKSGEPLKVQHHKDREHYTVVGNRESFAQSEGANMCLFNVISDQTGVNSDTLKKCTLDWMESNKVELSKQSADITRLEIYDGLKLCLGGAQYAGKSPSDAKSFIDHSQGISGHSSNSNPNYVPPPGHARGHASNPSAVGQNESVEEYSKTDPAGKTGFLSYDAQDFVAHYALQHPKTQKKIGMLNKSNTPGSYRQTVKLTRAELNLPSHPTFTKGGKWLNGIQQSRWELQEVVLVLQHHQGQYTNAGAPVFIHTIFPKP